MVEEVLYHTWRRLGIILQRMNEQTLVNRLPDHPLPMDTSECDVLNDYKTFKLSVHNLCGTPVFCLNIPSIPQFIPSFA